MINKCRRCGCELEPIILCRYATDPEKPCKDWDENECPDLDCFEPIIYGEQCPNCGMTYP